MEESITNDENITLTTDTEKQKFEQILKILGTNSSNLFTINL